MNFSGENTQKYCTSLKLILKNYSFIQFTSTMKCSCGLVDEVTWTTHFISRYINEVQKQINNKVIFLKDFSSRELIEFISG